MYAIITFHSIDDSGAVLAFPPSLFEYLLQTLYRKQIPVLDLDMLLSPGTNRGVALTFDDGMQSVHAHALPILRDYAVPSHLYACTDLIGRDRQWPEDDCVGRYDMLSWDQVADLQHAGVRIDAHTRSHPDMRGLDVERLEEECARSDEIITTRTSRRPRYFAYPYGYHDAAARRIAGERYRASVSTELAFLDAARDHAALPRIDSYYLRSRWMIENVDSRAVRLYMRARSALRTARRSQCPAGS